LSSFWLRTGRFIDWSPLGIKVFGAPLVFAPIDGPIHKRAPIAEQGYFLGYQHSHGSFKMGRTRGSKKMTKVNRILTLTRTQTQTLTLTKP
jgi:hypothetical protein